MEEKKKKQLSMLLLTLIASAIHVASLCLLGAPLPAALVRVSSAMFVMSRSAFFYGTTDIAGEVLLSRTRESTKRIAGLVMLAFSASSMLVDDLDWSLLIAAVAQIPLFRKMARRDFMGLIELDAVAAALLGTCLSARLLFALVTYAGSVVGLDSIGLFGVA
jgi:hypothetical protein